MGITGIIINIHTRFLVLLYMIHYAMYPVLHLYQILPHASFARELSRSLPFRGSINLLHIWSQKAHVIKRPDIDSMNVLALLYCSNES